LIRGFFAAPRRHKVGKLLAKVEWANQQRGDWTLMNDAPVGFKLNGLRARYRFAFLVFLVNEAAFIFLSLYVSGLFLLLPSLFFSFSDFTRSI
jgi:hypothetical protein